jgi:ATP-dependent DNA helicase RecG
VKPAELEGKLRELMALPVETEWVEFKAATGGIDLDKLGRYFCALSNEANLNGQATGWLILGVTDTVPRAVVGTKYKPQPADLEHLKHEIAQHTNHQITLVRTHELTLSGNRALMFEVPPAVRGIPTEWRGRVYGRHGESVSPLSLQEIDRIRGQVTRDDWSAALLADASFNALDPEAIAFARGEYRKKHPALAMELDGWDDATFLNKAKVCISGTVTRTAVVLLGKAESEHLLSPAVARITWILRDADGVEKDYEHFGSPMILSVGRAFAKVRNLTYRYMPNASLFPTEITQYDPWVIRETLHNCIAHQDYTRGGRVNVVEEPESLLFTNLGEFLPGSVEEAIRHDAPPEYYRNRFLVEAMVNLNMIDSVGSGIKRMFRMQRERFFPLPDYDLAEPGRVKVRIFGKVLDEKYTRMLIHRRDLDLAHVIALDKVQKGRPLSDDEFRALKRMRLIEGRRPNLFVSAEVAAATDSRADYIRKRAFDREHYKDLILAYLREYGQATTSDIRQLLMDKVSDALSQEQKMNWIRNLLGFMSREDKTIRHEGPKRGGRWVLASMQKRTEPSS